MELNDVKAYLRIDDDADDTVLELMMQAAEEYIQDAVGWCDLTYPKMKLLYFLILQDFYENRVLVVKEADRQRLTQVASSMILQLQLEGQMKEEADGHRETE